MTARLRRSTLIGCFVGFLAAASAAQPTPQARAHAEALFREGVKLANERAFDQACPKLAESQRLDPQPGTLLYLATCHEQQGKTATAWIEYNRVTTLAARLGQRDRADLAKQRAAQLESSLSYVVIKVEGGTEDVTVTLDGEELGAASLGTRLPVDPGEHSIEARAPNRRSWSSTFTVTAGQAVSNVTVPALEIAPAGKTNGTPPKISATPSTTEPKVDHGSPALRTVGFVSLGVGVAGLATGTYFGLRARSLWNDSKAYCSDRYCEEPGLEKTDDAKRAALVSTIAFGVGIAASGAGIYFLLASRGKPAPTSGLVVTSRPAAGGAMVDVRSVW